MEMQQVRYFLPLSSELSFTRAAEECMVRQKVTLFDFKGQIAMNDILRFQHQSQSIALFGRLQVPICPRRQKLKSTVTCLSWSIHPLPRLPPPISD